MRITYTNRQFLVITCLTLVISVFDRSTATAGAADAVNVLNEPFASYEFENPSTYADGLVYTRDGKFALVGEHNGESGQVTILNASTAEPVGTLAIVHGRVFDIAVSPDGRLVAATTSSVRHRVCVWELESRKLVSSFYAMYIKDARDYQIRMNGIQGYPNMTSDTPSHVHFLSDSKTLAVVHHGGSASLTFCDIENGQMPRFGGPAIHGQAFGVASCSSTDGQWLALGSIVVGRHRHRHKPSSSATKVEGVSLQNHKRHKHQVLYEPSYDLRLHGLCFSPNQEFVAMAGQRRPGYRYVDRSELNSFFDVHDLKTSAICMQIPAKTNSNWPMSFLSDNRTLAVRSSKAQEIDLWDTKTAELRLSVKLPKGDLRALAGHPNRPFFVSRDRYAVRFWRSPASVVSPGEQHAVDSAHELNGTTAPATQRRHSVHSAAILSCEDLSKWQPMLTQGSDHRCNALTLKRDGRLEKEY